MILFCIITMILLQKSIYQEKHVIHKTVIQIIFSRQSIAFATTSRPCLHVYSEH